MGNSRTTVASDLQTVSTVIEDQAELSEASAPRDRAPVSQQVIVFLAVVLPFVAFIAAIILMWGRGGVYWPELTVFGLMYFITGFGVTIGYHRLFTHRSFETIRPVKWIFAIAGSMAVEGPLLKWVAMHRRHHQHSDEHHDPHSPHGWGAGLKGVIAGFWHAHVGWLFLADPPELEKYVKDLHEDRALRTISHLFPLWVVLGLLIPTVLGGIMTQSWLGALLGFIWGGLVRVFMVHHITWSINSVCHLWGSKTYKSKDESRNNAIFGV
ncbi:MAG: acyl-CoA desaturase, partial [Phycisphaerae bacterium]